MLLDFYWCTLVTPVFVLLLLPPLDKNNVNLACVTLQGLVDNARLLKKAGSYTQSLFLFPQNAFLSVHKANVYTGCIWEGKTSAFFKLSELRIAIHPKPVFAKEPWHVQYFPRVFCCCSFSFSIKAIPVCLGLFYLSMPFKSSVLIRRQSPWVKLQHLVLHKLHLNHSNYVLFIKLVFHRLFLILKIWIKTKSKCLVIKRGYYAFLQLFGIISDTSQSPSYNTIKIHVNQTLTKLF